MNLATIQIVKEIKEHPNADALELATILGWQVVVKKGQFVEGDKVVYIGLDSILPEHSHFDFLAKQKYRIKTCRLRGEMSYGIVFTVEQCADVINETASKNFATALKMLPEGCDITEELGVKKYEKPLPLNCKAKGNFPSDIVRKTDEERVQNIPQYIEQLGDEEIYISVKADGSSLTVVKVDGELMVCSRNLALKEPTEEERENGEISSFWTAVEKYNLRDIPDNTYVQCELIGHNIQGNPHGIQGYEIRVFNVGKAQRGQKQEQYGLDDMLDFCDKHQLPTVEILYRGVKNFETIADLEEIANSVKYENGKSGEGVVIRLTEAFDDFKMQKPLSFKMISPRYALKHGE